MTVNTNVNLTYPSLNADGLMVWYGISEDTVDRGGYLSTCMGVHCTEFNVGFADVALGTDQTHNFVLSYNTHLPKGAFLEKFEFYVTEVWASTSSDVTLNFGLIKQSDFSIVDGDGIAAAIAKTAIDTAGAIIEGMPSDSLPAASTYAGALLGTALTENDLVVCSWGNHAPTAGAGTLKVFWRANKAA